MSKKGYDDVVIINARKLPALTQNPNVTSVSWLLTTAHMHHISAGASRNTSTSANSNSVCCSRLRRITEVGLAFKFPSRSNMLSWGGLRR